MDEKLIATCDVSTKSLNKIPEWIPEDFKKQFKADEQIIKDPRMLNFRSNVAIEQNFVKPYERLMIAQMNGAIYNINLFVREIYATYGICYQRFETLREENSKKLSSLRKAISHYRSLDFNQQLIALRANKILVGKQKFKLSTFYNKIVSNYKDMSEQIYKIVPSWRDYTIPDFDELKNKKDWDLRLAKTDAKYCVVFTTQCEDILGMSARSEWTSCQDIRPSKVISKEYDPRWAKQVVGSAISKYIGIIYLTDGSDYEGRGERMFYRCTVWLLRIITNNQDVLWIHKMYPQEDEFIRNIFIHEMTAQEKLLILSLNKPLNQALRVYKEIYPLGWQAYDDSGFYSLN